MRHSGAGFRDEVRELQSKERRWLLEAGKAKEAGSPGTAAGRGQARLDFSPVSHASDQRGCAVVGCVVVSHSVGGHLLQQQSKTYTEGHQKGHWKTPRKL